MSPINIDEALQDLLSASKTSRYLLALVVAFSVIISTQFYNSWRLNWASERISTLVVAEALYECSTPSMIRPFSLKAADGELVVLPFSQGILGGCGAACGTVADDWVNSATGPNAKSPACSHLSHPRARTAARHVLVQGFGPGDVRDVLESARLSKLAQISGLTVPIIGLDIDVNGLGVLSGVGFFALVGLLSLALGREAKVLKDTSTEDQDSAERSVLFNKKAGRVVIWAPSTLVASIFINDVFTLGKGWMSSEPATVAAVVMGLSAVAANLAVARVAWREFQHIADVYEEADLTVAAERAAGDSLSAKASDMPVHVRITLDWAPSPEGSEAASNDSDARG